MPPLKDHIRRLRRALRHGRQVALPLPSEVEANFDLFLGQRRAYLDSWFLLVRIALGLGLISYLILDAVGTGFGLPVSVLLVTSYLLANIGVRIACSSGFQHTRWVYAGLDLVAFLLLRHLFQFEVMVDANATMVGCFTLLLVAYTLYSDPRLSGFMALATLAGTVLTLWIDAIRQSPPEASLLSVMLAYRTHPLRALLLFSYLGSICLVTHRLAHRLYTQLLRYNVEHQKRTRAAVASAAERARRERLEKLNQLKRDFITVLSHELRTPMTPLLTSLGVLKEEFSREILEIAVDSAAQLQRLMDDYIQLAELLTLEDESLQRLNMPLADIMTVLRTRTSHRDFVMDGLGDLVVCTEPRLLGGTLLALMRRAELLTPADHPIVIRGAAENDTVTLAFHDPANHLEPQVIESLDDPFALSDERAFFSPSTGLELTLARHALRRIGGTLHIESTPEDGTTIRCTLPGSHAEAPWLDDAQFRFALDAAGL
ncbi:MAG: sensor histidine kinase [Rhodothermales bacterium]